MFGVCGVARYNADITGSLTVLTYLFPFCSEVSVLLQVTWLPALCHLILKVLFQPTGCPPHPHLSSSYKTASHRQRALCHFVTRLTFQMGEAEETCPPLPLSPRLFPEGPGQHTLGEGTFDKKVDRKGLALCWTCSALAKVGQSHCILHVWEKCLLFSFSFFWSLRASSLGFPSDWCPPPLGKSPVLLSGFMANFVHCALLAEAPGGRCGAGPGR